MKRFLKIFGGLVIAVILTVCGYVAGTHNSMDIISSALPRVNITHGAPDEPRESGLPENDENAPRPVIGDSDEPTDPEATGRTVVKTNESAVGEHWSLLKSYTGDLMNSGENAVVSLYTSAQTIDGEIIWDDSQQWVVEVSDAEGGYYVLTDKYISNGSAYIEVTETDGSASVTVFTKTSAGMEIKQYTYGKNGFTETVLYSSGTANILYSSLPDYQ